MRKGAQNMCTYIHTHIAGSCLFMGASLQMEVEGPWPAQSQNSMGLM